MSSRQARRRKAPIAPPQVVLRLPRAFVRAATVLGVTAVLAGGALLGARAEFNVPIEKMTIDAPFQRVSALQITEAIADDVERGFIGFDLSRARERIEALDWVDRASVRRVWPDALEVVVTEQLPAAKWGDSGLLNTRGELFSEASQLDLPELPRLSGPPRRLHDVASQYLGLRGPLIEAGLGLRAVTMNNRGAWQFVLGNGIEIRLGREQVEARAQRFIQVAAPVVARHAEKIRHVDMRYSNGFAIGWKREEFRNQVRLEAAQATAAQSTGVDE